MTSLGLIREVATEGGGGSVHLVRVILHGGTIGAAIWGGDLGAVRFNVGKT